MSGIRVSTDPSHAQETAVGMELLVIAPLLDYILREESQKTLLQTEDLHCLPSKDSEWCLRG